MSGPVYGRPAVPLSYTAIDERLGARLAVPSPVAVEGETEASKAAAGRDVELEREGAAARGIAVHALLEWSHANAWATPPDDVIERIAADAAAQKGIDAATALAGGDLLAPLRAWTGSALFAERIAAGAARTRVEVPLLMQLAGRVIRGSIDLLAEEPASPPLIVDYKTDRLGEASVGKKAGEYETQRDLYALAVAEASGANAVEVAYVFLERPAEPSVQLLDGEEISAGKARLEEKVARVEEASASGLTGGR